MKILLTTDTYYPYISGVVISTHNLYKELKAMGHDVRILTLSENGKEKINGDIYKLKSFDLRIYPGLRLKRPFNTEVEEAIIDWKPDIIHSQTEFSTMINAKHIAYKLKIPHIHTYHTMYEDYLDYILSGKILTPRAMAKITKILLNTFNRVIVPTNKVEKALRGYGVESPISIIPTGIDLSKFQKNITLEEKIELREKYGINSSDSVLLFLGRVAYEKNIDEIIKMFSNLKNNMNNLKLLIVGQGPYLDNLKALAKAYALEDKAIFTGMVPPNEVYKYYKISDAFVTASTSETQGLTYIEALSSGLPVICRYDSCIEGVVNPEINGFIYNNEEEFTQAVKTLFSDEEYKNTLGRNAELTADTFSSGTFAKKVASVYEEILKEKGDFSNQFSA